MASKSCKHSLKVLALTLFCQQKSASEQVWPGWHILHPAGAALDGRDYNGWTPLMFAASKTENPKVIIRLLKAGADEKAKTKKGYTALDYAKVNETLEGTDALKKLEEASK